MVTEVHAPSGEFFIRQEVNGIVYWNLARYPADVSDAKAISHLRERAYMRTVKDDVFTYTKVSDLLKTDRRLEVLAKINHHMGII